MSMAQANPRGPKASLKSRRGGSLSPFRRFFRSMLFLIDIFVIFRHFVPVGVFSIRRYFQSTFFLFVVLSQLAFFPFDIISCRRFVFFDIQSRLTFFLFYLLSQSVFFSIQRFVPFGAFPFNLLCVNAFYRKRFYFNVFRRIPVST